MGANKFKASFHRNTPRITRVLIYSLLEWILIVLLLLNGLFSYFISKFASFFGLKPPCVLCSRVDHLFEPDSSRKSYRRYLCHSHKVEVSQLGFCSLHKRLAEAGDMCEDCGSSRPAPGGGGAVLSWMRRSEMGEKDLKCSCCGIALESGFYSPYFLSKPNWGVLDHYALKDDLGKEDAIFEVEEGKIVGFDVLDRVDEREIERAAILDGENIVRNDNHDDSIFEPEEVRRMVPMFLEKDKVTDREFQNENTDKDAHSEVEKENNLVPNSEEEPLIKLYDSIPDAIGDASVITLQNLDQNVAENARLTVLELLDSITLTNVHDSSQLHGEQREIRSDKGLAVHDLVPLDLGIVSEEEKNLMSVCEEERPALVEQSSSNALNQEGIEEDNKEELDISIGSEIAEQEQIEPVLPNTHDLISPSVNQSSNTDLEVMVKDQLENSLVSFVDLSSVQVDESVKGLERIETERVQSTIPTMDHLLPIQDSNGCREHNCNQSEDETLPETPTHITSEEDMHILQRRLIFDKNEPGPESVDGLSLNSETDLAEPLSIDQLKSALQSERSALRAIYLELEEERSASAIAANQTMAMINRLQEEKAAMQMEALQYQRMMEEQSEYDQEALQMLNELVVKREREKEELEKELEAYKHKVQVLERNIGRGRDASLEKKSGSESSSSSSSDSLEYGVALENGNDDYAPGEGHLISLESSLDEFEEERKSILEQLKGLEERVFSLEEGSEEDKRSIDESRENENHYQDYESVGDMLNVPANGSIKHNYQGKNSGFRGKRLLPLFDAVSLENGEETEEENGDYRTVARERMYIQGEVNEVYERLQALEADREFIKHCVKSLKKGDAGLDLLQEILQHLRDLKRMELRETNSGEIASLSM
ncbi:hypothetical protein LUZ61_001429 [Rhynchospora tenuis]|uniref:GTD-binding domain-containing protein n=1 Tax=Rhynchospora tenuis TaxID=198213 RepID=A0AAD5ZHE1_9POAL|nr:hypothetical protein LUZ61_001429 [Rhynchospora tenuis]